MKNTNRFSGDEGTTHLSAELLDGLMIDPAAAELEGARRHVATCATCAARLARERAWLGEFGMASTAMADAAMERLVMRPPAVPEGRWREVRSRLLRPVSLAGGAVAAAAVALAVALGTHQARPHDAARQPELTAAGAHVTGTAAARSGETVAKTSVAESSSSSAADEALLLGVDRELSMSVASPLEPLSDPLQTKASTQHTQQN